MVPPARTVEAMAPTASAIPERRAGSESSVTEGRRKLRAAASSLCPRWTRSAARASGRPSDAASRLTAEGSGRGATTHRSTGAGEMFTVTGYLGPRRSLRPGTVGWVQDRAAALTPVQDGAASDLTPAVERDRGVTGAAGPAHQRHDHVP